jgi:hypothetical protein
MGAGRGKRDHLLDGTIPRCLDRSQSDTSNGC